MPLLEDNTSGQKLFDILVNNGFHYELYLSGVEAKSVPAAREWFKRSGDWRADDFRVRRTRGLVSA